MHLDLYSGCRSQNIRCEPETGDYLGIIIRQLWITKKKKKKKNHWLHMLALTWGNITLTKILCSYIYHAFSLMTTLLVITCLLTSHVLIPIVERPESPTDTLSSCFFPLGYTIQDVNAHFPHHHRWLPLHFPWKLSCYRPDVIEPVLWWWLINSLKVPWRRGAKNICVYTLIKTNVLKLINYLN